MTGKQGYVLDTDAIINLARRIYPEEVFPQLHGQIDALINEDLIISSVEVLGELGIDFRKKPTLWLSDTQKKYPAEYNLPIVWAQKHPQIFLEFDPRLEDTIKTITELYDNIIKFKSTSGYDADIHLIALAQVNDWSVVTFEKLNKNKDYPKIPDICEDLGIACIDLLKLFRDRSWSF